MSNLAEVIPIKKKQLHIAIYKNLYGKYVPSPIFDNEETFIDYINNHRDQVVKSLSFTVGE